MPELPAGSRIKSRVNAREQSHANAGTEWKDKSELNTRYLLETIPELDNPNSACKRVKQNAGSPEADKIKVEVLLPYLRQHGESLKESILAVLTNPSRVRGAR